jgi:hypothetical protein
MLFNTFSFFNQFEQFIGHWTHQPKGYQHSLNIRSEGASQKRQKKRMSDSFFKNFEKITLYLSLVPAPYLPHF